MTKTNTKLKNIPLLLFSMLLLLLMFLGGHDNYESIAKFHERPTDCFFFLATASYIFDVQSTMTVISGRNPFCQKTSKNKKQNKNKKKKVNSIHR